ncbi:PAS domain S-box protein [uncultured Draconibacterium sp.]|uniref:bifunctional diguanylate cyclase/phosphodiesterase n=1 Tax=uncultured Draconibacterium sp. TaxID=1573823 RepID=UPI003216D51F
MGESKKFQISFDLLDDFLEGCQIIDFNQKYIYINNTACKQYGFSRDFVIGKSFSEVWPTDRASVLQTKVKDCLEKRNAHKFELSDGDSGCFEISIQAVKEGVAILSIDNTTHKAAKKRLRDSEDYSRQLFDESSIGLAVTNLKGQLLDINQAYANIIGYSIEEARKLTYWDITPKKYSQQENEQIKLLEQNGNYGPYEKEYIHKNGSLIPVRLQGNLIERHGEKLIWSSVQDISKSKQIEKALKESEDKFRKAFHTSPDSINITRVSDGKYLEINKGFENVIGYSKDEIIGKTSIELNIWKNPEDRKKLVSGLKERGFVSNLEAEFEAKDGSIIHGLMSANYIELNNEKVILSITRDITERKENELKIEESEKHFRTIFEQSVSGMILLSLDGKLLDVNVPYCEMLSYSADELKGNSVDDFTIPEDREIGNDIIKKMLSGEIQKAKFEKRYRTQKGKIIWVQVSSALLLDELGNPKYIVSQIEDITKQIEANKLLVASESKFKALVEQSLTGIYIFEKENFIYVNKRFCEIFGYNEDEIMSSMKPTDVISLEDRNRADENIKRRLEGEVQSVRYIAKGNHKNGELLWVEIHGTHIQIEDKAVITGTVLDITERKKNEEKIIKLNAELEQKVKERTTELESKMNEVERMNKLFVGRELRMKELKEKIKKLEMGSK